MARRRVEELTRSYLALEEERAAFQQGLKEERRELLDADRVEVARALLEAMDGLDAALAGSAGSAFARGVQLARRMWEERVQRLGLERVSLVGALFDPSLAEAIEEVPTTEPEQDKKVVAEVLAAYRLNGKVVRPGRVRIAHFTPPAS